MVNLRSLAEHSFRITQAAWTKGNDIYLNIDTAHSAAAAHTELGAERSWWLGPIVEDAKHLDNHQYTSPDYWHLRKVLGKLDLGSDDVFYDIGAGKGRVICLVARKPIRKCVGIELLQSLCEVATHNASRLRGKQSDVEIRCTDAAHADLSDGTVYFMFNPFGAETMRDTLENIRTSLTQRPRSIRLIYYNPVHESLLQATSWLEMFQETQTVRGARVTFWRSVERELSIPGPHMK